VLCILIDCLVVFSGGCGVGCGAITGGGLGWRRVVVNIYLFID